MISRRNIRVKVMQTLYAAKSAVEQDKKDTPEDTLKKKIEQSCKLFSYLVYFLS